MRRFIAISGLLAATTIGASALAEPTPEELSTARSLFRDGVTFEKAGNYEAALVNFRKVSRVVDSPTAHYHLGVCLEALGRLAEALNEYEFAVKRANEVVAQEVIDTASPRVDDLRRRAPKLLVTIPADAEGLQLTLDGKPIHAALAGSPFFVNPGKRRLVVRASNYERPFEAEITATESSTQEVAADLGAKIAKVSAKSSDVKDERAARSSEPSIVPVVAVGGVTLALAGAAIGTGIVAAGKADDYETANANPTHDAFASREALRDDALTMQWVSTALTLGAVAGAGVTGVLLGLTLAASDERVEANEARRGPRFSVAPWATPDAAGLSALGRF